MVPFRLLRSLKSEKGTPFHAWSYAGNKVTEDIGPGEKISYAYGPGITTVRSSLEALESNFQIINCIVVGETKGNVTKYIYQYASTPTDINFLDINLMLSKKSPEGIRTEYTYDGGLVTAEKVFGVDNAQIYANTYEYDSGHLLTKTTHSYNGGSYSVLRTYSDGRLATMTQPEGTSRMSYNGQGLMLQSTGPGYDKEYDYTETGLMTKRVNKLTGLLEQFGYDDQCRLVSTTTQYGKEVKTYGGDGRIVSVVRTGLQPGEVSYQFDDPNGTTTSVSKYGPSNTTETRRYDKNGRMIQQDINGQINYKKS